MIRDGTRFLGPLRPLAKRAAKFCFPRYSWLLDRLNWEARLQAAAKQFPGVVELATREDLYTQVSDNRLEGGRRAIDYLEFGVFEGASIRFWSSLNPKSWKSFLRI